MEFLRIKEQIHKTGFDEFYQAGTPNKFSKMNVVAESKKLNKQFWICVEGGYMVKDTFFIAFRPLNNTKAKTERIYCKNQTEVVTELKKIAVQILVKKREETMLNLEAKTNNEKLVLDYLDKNASYTLAEKINNSTKTLSQCWSYIVSEAQKQAVNGCACIDDATVFGWAIHFFEEDSIEAKHYEAKATVKTTAKAEKKPEPKAPKKPKSEPVQLDQISLF